MLHNKSNYNIILVHLMNDSSLMYSSLQHSSSRYFKKRISSTKLTVKCFASKCCKTAFRFYIAVIFAWCASPNEHGVFFLFLRWTGEELEVYRLNGYTMANSMM